MTDATPRRAERALDGAPKHSAWAQTSSPAHAAPRPAHAAPQPAHAAHPAPEPAHAAYQAPPVGEAQRRAAEYAFSDDPTHSKRRVYRRRYLRTSLLMTFLSTLVPGLGLLGARSKGMKVFGALLTLGVLGGCGFLGYWAYRNQSEVLVLASDTFVLTLATPVLIAIGLVWVTIILVTYLNTRPPMLRSGRRLVGALTVMALSFAVAAPTAVAARYTRDAYLLINNVLPDDVVALSRPTLDEEDPWANKPRLNLLLLGADGAASRAKEVKQFGVRTDTIIVASIDTATGDTTLIHIPRNVQFTPFPRGSEMAKAFPNGFRGEGDPGEWYINSILPKVELDYPDLMKGNTFRGVEALKLGVEGVTGLKIDYFMMLNIDGLRDLIDAMGGVTVNINQRLPIGGSSSNPVASSWLEQGPNQHLDGSQGLWYARSRWSTDDYDRMRRQSCLINAIVDQADPTTIVTRFEPIAAAGGELVTTDIPNKDAKAIIELAMRVKDADVNRLVFSDGSHGYSYHNPNFRDMRAAVAQAIDPPEEPAAPQEPEPVASEPASPEPVTSSEPALPEEPSVSSAPTEAAENVTDACAYHPVN